MQLMHETNEAARLAALRRYNVLDTEPEAPFDKITLLVKRLFDVPMAVVSLVDDERQWFKSRQGMDVCETARDISFCTHTIRHDEPLVVEDAQADPRFRNSPLVTGKPWLRSYAGVPLRTPEGYNVGSLCVMDTVARSFDAAKIDMLRSFASIVVDELELRRIAQKDHLTGALTRRAFIGETERAIALYARNRIPGALILLDLDRFKAVNDTYGHPAGDRVLSSFAAACRAMLRRGDVFGRVGGEEFAILVQETNAEDAMRCAERFRRAIAALTIENDPPLHVTASFGLAMLAPGIVTGEEWMAAADIGLYEAKTSGRNRCCHSRPAMGSAAA